MAKRNQKVIDQINKMILATLKTKRYREPKYRKELEDLGLFLVNRDDISTYDYWGITTYPDNMERILVISQDGHDVRILCDPFHTIAKRDQIEKVDLWNFLQVHWERYLPFDEKYPQTPVQRYRLLAGSVKSYERQLQELDEKIRKLEEQKKAALNGYQIALDRKKQFLDKKLHRI